ncbi:MAG: GntR family transcriptional regulator [Thermodesulfobacteriota bacterium]
MKAKNHPVGAVIDFPNRADAGPQLLRVQVYKYLRRQLMKGDLKPGAFIRLDDLTKKLGISRTPLREALIQLRTEGFVTFLPQRGIVINEVTLEELIKIYEICGALESRVLVSVFDSIGPKEIEKMSRLNEEMNRHTSEREFDKYLQKNLSFHNVFLSLSRNELLLNYLNILRLRAFDFTRRDWERLSRDLNYREHIRLLELLRSRRKEEAAAYLRDVHWSYNW